MTILTKNNSNKRGRPVFFGKNEIQTSWPDLVNSLVKGGNISEGTFNLAPFPKKVKHLGLVIIWFGFLRGMRSNWNNIWDFLTSNTLMTLLRIPYLGRIGSTSFVLPIRQNTVFLTLIGMSSENKKNAHL